MGASLPDGERIGALIGRWVGIAGEGTATRAVGIGWGMAWRETGHWLGRWAINAGEASKY